MQFTLSFKTAMFDVTKEDENPVNPIFGQSLLVWLKGIISDDLEMESPDAEDWGWYSYIHWKGRKYLLGSTAYFEEGDDPRAEIEYVLQIHKIRSFKEKLFGHEKMSHEDECFTYIKYFFESESNINSLVVE